MKLINIFNDGREIKLFCRNDKGELEINTVKDFFPYFYEKSFEGTFKSYKGDSLRKMFVSSPFDINKQRSKEAFEADIHFVKRYLIDKVPTLDKCPIKYTFIDVEVQSDELPNVTRAEKPVSCITAYNSFSKEYKTFYLGNYKTEFELIEDFIHYMKQEKFDIWFSWHVDFDYNYLYNRIPDFAEKISSINKSRYGKEDVYYPAGMSIVDYLSWFKKVTLNKEQQYTLDYIAEKHLGKGKEYSKVDFSKVSEEIKKRNIEDVEIMVKLEEKFKLISYYDEVRRLAKVEWEDLIWNSRTIDMLLLQEAKNQKVVLPMKPKDNEKEDFLGAFREAFETGAFTDGICEYDLGCYSEDTEILTEDGWTTYDKLYGNNKLATLNIKTNKIEFQSMLHLNVQKVKNINMININGKYTDQLLTETHKVLFKQTTKKYRNNENDPNSWHIQFAKDVPIHHSIFPLSAEIKNKNDYSISDELLQVHAWIITEGWKRKSLRQKRIGYSISQSYKHQNNCAEIAKLFEVLNWNIKNKTRKRPNKKYEEMELHIPVEYSQYIKLEDNHKAIPLWMLQNFSLRQLNLLYITLMKGDGDSNRDCYYAINNLARDRFQYLCCLIGRASYNNGKKEVYCKSLNYTSVQTAKKGKKIIKYSGIVWCPTVVNGYVVVRRKGKAFISGNSAYPFAIINFCLDPVNIREFDDRGMIADGCEILPINNTHFAQNADALLPTVVKKMVILKNNIAEEIKKFPLESTEYKDTKVKYNAIKSIVNSCYGVMGNRFFRLYDKRVASATTFLVRDLLHYVKDNVEAKGYKIIYIDTDSVFIKSRENLTNFLNELIQKWGKEKYSKEHVDINFDYKGIYEKLLILAKCRYVGYLTTDKGIEPKVKGVEVKRKDSTVFMKKFQRTLIDKILDKEHKPDIIQWIKEQVKEIRKCPISEIAFPCKLGRKPEEYKNTPIFLRALNCTDGFSKKVGNAFYYIYMKPFGHEEITKEVLMMGGKKLTSSMLKIVWKIKYDEDILVKNMDADKKAELVKELITLRKVTLEKTIVKGKIKNVMAFDEEEFKHINLDNVCWDTMIKRNIYMKLETIFLAMKWNMEEVTL